MTGLISLLCKGLLRVFSCTTIGKYQFFRAHTSLRSNSHIHTWLLEKPQLWPYEPLSAKWCIYLFFNMLSQFSSVQSLSRVRLIVTPWIAACQASLSITNSWSLLKLMSIESVMPSSHLILCHPFSCLQSLLASGSFPMSQLLTWGGQSIGVSASASVLPMNIQDWSPLGWTGWTSLQSKGLSRIFSNTTVQNMLSRFVIAFLPWSRCILISWLQSPSTVILESKKIKSVLASTFSFYICHEFIGPDATILVFLNVEFQVNLSLSFTLIKRLFSSSSLPAIGVVSSSYLRLLILPLSILIPACDLSIQAFCMMYFTYKLNN